MKQRHIPSIRANAKAVLTSCNIAIGQDFHTLGHSQIEALVTEADHVRYQRPKNANGSRARYFHDKLQREARLID